MLSTIKPNSLFNSFSIIPQFFYRQSLYQCIRNFSVLTDEDTDDEDKPFKERSRKKERSIPVRWKIVLGDTATIMTGRERGKSGRVIDVDELKGYLRLKGCLLKSHKDKEGEIVLLEETIHYSRIALIDPVYKKPCKVSIRFAPNNDLLRISKLSGAIIPWPNVVLKAPTAYGPTWVDGPKDTPPEIALDQTFDYYEDKDKRNEMRQTMTKFNQNYVSY